MNHEPEYQQFDRRSNTFLGVLIALLAGVLTGAVTMLLLAPQSGKKTRKQIEEKSIELRDMAAEVAGDTAVQIRSKANKLMTSGLKNFKKLKLQGQELALEQLVHVSDTLKADKETTQNA
jgi:gas vesicle protein